MLPSITKSLLYLTSKLCSATVNRSGQRSYRAAHKAAQKILGMTEGTCFAAYSALSSLVIDVVALFSVPCVLQLVG